MVLPLSSLAVLYKETEERKLRENELWKFLEQGHHEARDRQEGKHESSTLCLRVLRLCGTPSAFHIYTLLVYALWSVA